MTALQGVLASALAGDLEGGLALHAALPNPSASDDRWAGVCCLGLGQVLEAKRLLARAITRGALSARIELAAVYRREGNVTLARQTLAAVDVEALNPFDRVLALRELAGEAQFDGQLVLARERLERAWVDGQGVDVGEAFLAPVAQVLGSVLTELGHAERGVQLLTYAARHANSARLAYVHGARGLALTFAGRHEEADAALSAAATHARRLPLALPVLAYYRGLLERARGDLGAAEHALTEADALARAGGEEETQTYVRLAWCAVSTSQGRFDEARGHLARASSLAAGLVPEALVLVRRAALQTATGTGDPATALEAVAGRLGQARLLRVQGWALLHAAEAHFAASRQEDALGALEQAVDVVHAMGSPQGLGVELRYLPRAAADIAARDPGSYVGGLRTALGVEHVLHPPLRLETLGAARLVVGERAARLDLARSVEVLAWLLDHPRVRLGDVQLALFPEVPHRRSKSYFHQVRDELERVAPGLRVPYDRETRTYRVTLSGVTFSWDAQNLRRILDGGVENAIMAALDGYPGAFLPDADSDWARWERDDLKSLILRVGLRTLDEWYHAGEHEKVLALARRLVNLDPLDDAVNEFLLRAIFEVEGERAARQVYRRLRDHYEDEVGSLPPNLAAFATLWQRTN